MGARDARTDAPAHAGIMLEVSTGPALIDNNVIFATGGQGGIFESDSNNATIAHNLVMNPVGAALYMSGTGGGRHYNCRQVDGEGVRIQGLLVTLELFLLKSRVRCKRTLRSAYVSVCAHTGARWRSLHWPALGR